MPNPNPPFQMAGNESLGAYEPIHLFAGEKEIVTESFTVGADLKQYEVFAQNAAGAAVKLDPAAVDTTAVAVGVTCYAVTLTNGGKVSGYTSAFLNHEALVWPAALDTLEKRRTAMRGTEVRVGTVL